MTTRDTSNIHIKLPRSDHEAIKNIAWKQRTTVSELIREFIRQEVKNKDLPPVTRSNLDLDNLPQSDLQLTDQQITDSNPDNPEETNAPELESLFT